MTQFPRQSLSHLQFLKTFTFSFFYFYSPSSLPFLSFELLHDYHLNVETFLHFSLVSLLSASISFLSLLSSFVMFLISLSISLNSPPPSHPGSLFSFQPLHDHHGVHVFIILLLLIFITLLWLLQPFLELPLQHQLPEAVALLCRSFWLCLGKQSIFLTQLLLLRHLIYKSQDETCMLHTCSSWISLSSRSTMWSCCCFSAFSRASLFQGSGDRLSLDVSSSLLMVMYCRSRLSIVRGCCCGSNSLMTVSIPMFTSKWIISISIKKL